jgi:ribonuclease HI
MAIIRAPKKSKWYVVWIGHAPGVYPSWEKCRAQVENFPGSKYRAYDTLAEAKAAYEGGLPVPGGKKK